MDFKKKVALITHTKKRIGRAINAALAEIGAKTFTIPDDIDAGLPRLISEIQKASGKIDILINYLPTPEEDILETNARKISLYPGLSAFHNCLEAVSGIMLKQGSGRIVNVAGVAIRDYMNYMHIRNEVIKVTKTSGRELARKHIYMNAVIPCLIEGEDYHKIKSEYLKELALYLPVQRPARIEEIIGPILFLASDKASYLFAETIKVDGGLSA